MKPASHQRFWRLLAVGLLALGGAAMRDFPVLAAGGSASSSATSSNAAPSIGDSIAVTISIDVSGLAAPDNALGGFSAVLDWNPAVLAYSGDSGIQSGFTGVVNTTNTAAGQLVFNGINIAGATGNVTVLTITFDAVGAGASPLDLGYSAMSAASTFANLLPLLAVADGRVVVGAVPHNLTVAVDPPDGGTTDPAVGVHAYAAGTVVDVTTNAGAAYRFDHWSGACSGAGACQVTTSADLTVTAHFAPLALACYDLTLSHAGEGSDPVADPIHSVGCPPGRYVDGEAIGLTGAVAGAGWQISGWTGTSQDSSTSGSNSLSMPASAHAASVIYRATIEMPVVLGNARGGDTDPSPTPVSANGAVVASASNPDAQPVSSTPPATPAQQIAQAQTAQDPTAGPTVLETNEVVETSSPEPDSGGSEEHPPAVSTQPGEVEKPLIADADRSGGDDSSSDAPGNPSRGSMTAAEQRSWPPLLPLVMVALIMLVGLVVVVISAFYLFKHKSGSGE